MVWNKHNDLLESLRIQNKISNSPTAMKANKYRQTIQFVKNKDYYKIHWWVRKNYGKAIKCESKDCNRKSKTFNWCLKKGYEYDRDINNFFQLCRSCHSKYDMTEQLRKKLSLSFRGRVFEKRRKKVKLSLKDGTLVKVFDTNRECAKFLGVSSGYISLYANNYPYRHILKNKYKISYARI